MLENCIEGIKRTLAFKDRFIIDLFCTSIGDEKVKYACISLREI